MCCYFWFRDFPAEMRNISAKERQHIEASCRYSSRQHLIPFKVIFKNRTLWALMCMYFCFQWANYFFVAWMPVYLQEGRHFSEAETSPIIFTLFIAGIIGLLVGGLFWRLDREKKRVTVWPAFCWYDRVWHVRANDLLFGTHVAKLYKCLLPCCSKLVLLLWCYDMLCSVFRYRAK